MGIKRKKRIGKRKKINIFSSITVLILVLGLLGWLLAGIFEGEKPLIRLAPLPEFISESLEFTITISDMKRGLKTLDISVNQGGRKITVSEKKFPFEGLLNSRGMHTYSEKFSIDPSKLNLAQGRVDLKISVRDYSRRYGGDGNLALVQHKMTMDTIPPAIRAISRMHNINIGGAGLVVYQASSDTIKSGLFVGELFFPGFPAKAVSQEGMHVCYFAVPNDTKAQPDVHLWAEDRAGNSSKTGLYYHVRRKRFRTERLNITDHFLNNTIPYFSYRNFDPGESNIKKFQKINRDIRQENNQLLYSLRTKTDPKQLWSGTWLRLPNAANMAKFGDRRLYFYKGKKIDQQVHLGTDLASLSKSKVPAANHGRVIFADRLGIYGLTVVLDHGQGLASGYSHLSEIKVEIGQEIMKGDLLGLTGKTGLAAGDHLHFCIMVGGVFVNPIEWWDSHWIQDNISGKLALLK